MRKPIILPCAAMFFACAALSATERNPLQVKAEQGNTIAKKALAEFLKKNRKQ